MTRWDAARAASKRPLRKPYVKCGPVGAPIGLLHPQRYSAMTGDVTTCSGCGHHVCSCPPKAIVGMDAGFCDSTAIIRGEWNAGKLAITESKVLPPDDGKYRCLACKRGDAVKCFYVGMGLKPCQQLIAEGP